MAPLRRRHRSKVGGLERRSITTLTAATGTHGRIDLHEPRTFFWLELFDGPIWTNLNGTSQRTFMWIHERAIAGLMVDSWGFRSKNDAAVLARQQLKIEQ
jgi:hypothetical protein